MSQKNNFSQKQFLLIELNLDVGVMVVVVCVTLFSCWSCFFVISKNIPSVVANYFSPIRDVENGDEKTLTHSHTHSTNNIYMR